MGSRYSESKVQRIKNFAKQYASSVCYFVVLRSGKKDRRSKYKEKVLFYEVRADGFDPDKIQGGGRPETPERNDIPDLLAKWSEYKVSGYKNPPGVEANALLNPGSEEPRCWWAAIKTIAEDDYNLAAGRYKPQIAEKAPDDDPVKLIRETLAIEQEIAEGLENLLREIEAVE